MLLKIFPSLVESKFIKAINWFFYSYFYVGAIALLTALCCIFGFEMPAFYIYVTCGCIIPCLFCKDMTPLLAPLAMAYSSVSIKTNNSKEGVTLFGGRWYHLYIIIGLIFIFVITRLIFDLITNKEKRHTKHYLLPGYLFFGVTLMLGGLLSGLYSSKDLVFGLVEFLALFGSYFLLLYLINWKEMKIDYLIWLMMFYGITLSMEVIAMQIVNLGEGVQTGWGCNNNIAGQLCMCIGAPIYLALKKKIAPIYLIICSIFMVCVGLTNSRTGVFISGVLFIVSIVILLIKGNKNKRIATIIVLTISTGLFFGFFFGFKDLSELLFGHLLHTFDNKEDLLSLSGRITIWKEGWQNYLNNRTFGTGWYHSPIGGRGNYFTYDFMPPRYHNTFFQLIGALGTFGLIAYIYHRYQTIRMTFTKLTLEKAYLFILILGLLLTSLLDCHLFNLGPGLNYCILLAAIEGINIKNDIKVNKISFRKFFN